MVIEYGNGNNFFDLLVIPVLLFISHSLHGLLSDIAISMTICYTGLKIYYLIKTKNNGTK